MPSPLPLTALLSQALVAFTIEFDNEFEHQMPHRTSRGGARQGPWLVSLAMWSNCMRFVGEQPALAGGQMIRATSKGRQAQQVWQPLFGVIEKRWQARFGEDTIGRLRESLWALVSRFDLELPDCLPIHGYGLWSRGPDRKLRAPAGRENVADLTLPALLSRVLLAFAIEFERESDLSLAICADIVRVLDEPGVRVRDLALLSGVSKEGIAMTLGFLQKRSFAIVETDPSGGRTKMARLTAKGLEAQAEYHRLLAAMEERWQARFGNDTIGGLRQLLERMAGVPLRRGLEPYPDGWRASVRKPDTLPHYPMVLHRGGFPDGS